MTKNELSIEQIKRQKVLPLFYHPQEEICLGVVNALYNAGVRSIEFTNRGRSALNNFKVMIAERNNHMKDLQIGVGTIRNSGEANAFMQGGADFLISPVFDESVCDAAYINKTLWIPGCMTPTEIHKAEQAGCTVIKLFPGNVTGPAFISSIKEIFPELDFIVTGGVEPKQESISSWFKSGVSAVGIGSKLISSDLMTAKDFKTIEANTVLLFQLLNDSI